MQNSVNKIIIDDFRLDVSIGIYEHEKAAKQEIIFGLEAEYLKGIHFESDEIDSTLNYERIIKTIKSCSTKRHYNLVETLAETLATELLQIDGLENIRLRLGKPGVLKGEKSGLLSVEIYRTR